MGFNTEYSHLHTLLVKEVECIYIKDTYVQLTESKIHSILYNINITYGSEGMIITHYLCKVDTEVIKYFTSKSLVFKILFI